jgi:hypothetical protein
MIGRKNKTDRLFRDRLRHFEAAPPEEAWRGIASALDRDKRKMRVIWIRRIAASVAVILAVGTIWIMLRESPESSPITRETTEAGAQDSPEAATGQIPEETLGQGTPAGGDIKEIHVEKPVPEMQAGLAEPILPDTPEESLPEGTEDDRTIAGVEDTRTMPGDQIPTGKLKPVPGIPAKGFKTEITEAQTLLAMRTYKSTPHEEVEGIVLIDEWGDVEQASRDKWGVGTQFSPGYSYRNLGASDGGAASSSYYNEVEEGMVSYAAGVNVHYSPLKRLSLQSGLYYSRMGVKIVNAYMAHYSESYILDNGPGNLAAISNSTGTIKMQQDMDYVYVSNAGSESAWDMASSFVRSNSFSTTDGEIHQHFEYIELPMILRYRVIDRRLGFNFLGGFSTNFLVGSNAYFQEGENREQIGTTLNLRPLNYSSIFGVGLDYSISKRFHINLEPTFRYYLNSINTGSGIKSHPYSIGFYTGILYVF